MKPDKPTRGGARPGAGRKTGSGPFGEPTQAMRLPESIVPAVKDFLAAYQAKHRRSESILEVLEAVPNPARLKLPLFGTRVPAGFPSPANDYLEATLDLNEYLVRDQESTYFVRVKGHSMTGAGIFDGDMLVVDRSIEPSPGKIIVAVVDGELTVKRLAYENGRPVLKAQNPHFKDIVLKDTQELLCWGVVTSTIRKLD